MMVAVLVGACFSWLAGRVVATTRANPLRSAHEVFETALRLAFDVIGEGGSATYESRWRARIHRAIFRLSRSALDFEELLADQDDTEAEHLRFALFEAELSASHIAEMVFRAGFTRRSRMIDLLKAFPDEGSGAVAGEHGLCDGEFRQALESLRTTLAVVRTNTPIQAAMQHTRPPHSRQESTAPIPALVLALQAAAATLAAIIAGRFLSATRWYWAPLTTLVIFFRVTTAGESIWRAWHRIIGTAIGVGAGLVLAYAARGQERTEIILIFVCMFFAYYLMAVSYAWMVGFITILLALLYQLLGIFTPELLLLRLAATAIGAAIGIIAALIIFPLHTSVKVQAVASEVLLAASALLASVANHAKPVSSKPEREFGYDLQQKIAELRTLADAVSGRWSLPSSWRLLELIHATAGLGFYANLLTSQRFPLPDSVRGKLSELAASIREAGLGLQDKSSARPDAERPRRSFAANSAAPENVPWERWLGRIEQLLKRTRASVSDQLVA